MGHYQGRPDIRGLRGIAVVLSETSSTYATSHTGSGPSLIPASGSVSANCRQFCSHAVSVVGRCTTPFHGDNTRNQLHRLPTAWRLCGDCVETV